MTSSKYEDPAAAGEVRLWSAPPVGETAVDPATGGEEVLPLPTPEEIERIQRQAYEEAYAQGLEAGRQAGEEAVRARAAELAAVLRSLARPLEALDERVESELVHLVVAVARQLIRREIRTDPGHIVAAVREAVGVLPSSDATVHLHLHPEDARGTPHDAREFRGAGRRPVADRRGPGAVPRRLSGDHRGFAGGRHLGATARGGGRAGARRGAGR